MTEIEKEEVREFVDRRDQIITAFIMEQTDQSVKDLFDFLWDEGYPISLDSFDTLRLAVYWTAQLMESLPPAVKNKAVERCIEMGCNPIPLSERTHE